MLSKKIHSAILLLITFFNCLYFASSASGEKKHKFKPSTPNTQYSTPNCIAIGNLANLPTFSVEEIEEIRRRPSSPNEGPAYEKIVGLLSDYDMAQPMGDFTLNKTFKVASFNIKRGFTLPKLKEAIKPDPIYVAMLEEFPEISEADEIDEARLQIRLNAVKNQENPNARITQFHSYLDALLNSENSQFNKIFSRSQVNKKLRQNTANLYEGAYALANEMYQLATADVIALQEVDWGMPRSGYAHVSKELAESNGYGYVFGTEFLELLDDGTAYPKVKNFDGASFKGLHGNSILSKWPIRNVRIIRFGESFTQDPTLKTMNHRRCYNWMREEFPQVGPFERTIYTGVTELVFDEKAIVPSSRLGSRMALVAEIITPKGPVTVVSTHLENRGSPGCRRAEMTDILSQMQNVTKQPVVIAGDLNTTNEEARRPYFRHVLYWYVKNQFELSTLAANIGSQVGLFFIGLPFPVPNPLPSIVQLLNQAREWRNPPGLGSAEKKLFRSVIDQFQFDDGSAIDTRGTPSQNHKGSNRYLANSNQTTGMGYKPTYCFQRNFKHLFCMKLDWILVKSNVTQASRNSAKCKVCPNNNWAPHNPRTLYHSMLAGGLSDHAAITTDLTLPE